MDCDNHNKPQYTFLTLNGTIYPNLIILKTETLNLDLTKHEIFNFNFHELKNKNANVKEYVYYLNNESINLINKIYDLDFLYFGYPKLN